MILSPYKTSLKRGYVDQEFYIEDTSLTSPNYFDITEFPDYIGGGKSVIKIKGAGLGLKFGAPIEAEVLDIDGNVVYSEFPDFIDKFNNIYLSIYVYDFVTKGVGTISLVSTAEYDPDGDLIPEDLQDSLNLRWTRDILILPDFRNNSIIDFAKGPTISAVQTITPFRVIAAYTSSLILDVTSSAVNYLSTDPVGYDFDQSTVDDVLDEYLNNILINPNETSRTANIVFSPPRIKDYDISSGYLLRENTRFNTYIYTSESFFKNEMTGGQFAFLSQPSASFPQLISGSTLTQPLQSQLSLYRGNIIKILDERRALIDKPVRVSTTIPNTINNQTSSFKYTNLETFTSSISYKPIDNTYIVSTNVSQSYVQFTMDDVDPIAGQVYRIKTFYKTSGQTGDYKLMADQYIKNIELLADPSRPNQVPYAKNESDYYLIGYFTDIRSVNLDPLELYGNTYWKSYNETPTGISVTTCTTSSQYASNAAVLTSSYSNSATFLFTTTAWQAYSLNNIYTLTFNCCLESGVELELYMNSTEISSEVTDVANFTRAFIRTENKEKTRYGGNFNRFGKFIGSIKNNNDIIKNYGRIAFDFQADSDGIGRPLFRLKYKDSSDGVGYISDINIKPQQIQGFTPSLIQYAVPVEVDFAPILSQSVDFKFEYYDYTGNQSEFVSYLKDIRINLAVDLPTLGCQSQNRLYTFPGFYRDVATDDAFVPIQFGDYNGKPHGALSGSTGTVYYSGPALTSFFGLGGSNAENRGMWNAVSYGRTTQTSFTITPPQESGSWEIYDVSVSNPSLQYSVDYPNLQDTSPIDDRYFTYGPACCINKGTTNISWSFFDSNGGFQPSTGNGGRDAFNALKRVRLIGPAGPFAQLNNPTSSLFDENGGLYQLTFKVKTYNSNPRFFNPDSGSKLNVFLFNATKDGDPNKTTIFADFPYAGLNGTYPPPQNIVTITFDSSTNWIDDISGYRYAQFSTTLVQYGKPAQLVFEASGSRFDSDYYLLSNGQWTTAVPGKLITPRAFGGCIDDIQLCKIGRTTDPFYIKPQTAGGGSVNLSL